MQEVIRIYTMLSFFIYIILCSVIYMIGREIIGKRNDKKKENLRNTFEKKVLNHIKIVKTEKILSRIDIDYIKESIKNQNYFEVFNDTIIQLNKKEENQKYVKKYISYFEKDILKIVKKYRKKDDIRKNYIVIILGEYRLNNYKLNEFLFECLNTTSMYLRIESLRAISKIGNTTNFIKALEFISEEEKYINDKIMVDVLDNFGGNCELLNKELLLKFNIFGENMQKDIIEHLKNKKVEFAKDKMIDILQNENMNKEVRISAIKYFSNISYKKAKDEIKNLLSHKEWEYRAISAYTLAKYKEKDVIEVLLSSITDYNWHVRFNSAKSLLSFNEDHIIERVLAKHDKYSRDILLYAMFTQEKISYDEYLEKTRKLEVDHAC